MNINRGFTTHNSVTPQRRADDQILLDALGILHRFALEQTGWRGWLRRWYYSDEPLRHDAANLVRRAGYLGMRPEHTELVGSYEHKTPPAVPVRAHCPVCGGPDTDDCERDDCGLMQAQYRMPRQS